MTEERAVEEGCLVDHRCAAAHLLERAPIGFTVVVDARLAPLERDDAVTVAGAQHLQVPPLVFFAFAANQVALRVVGVGPLEAAVRDELFELAEALALEIIVQVAGGVDEPSVETLHGNIVLPACAICLASREERLW